MFAEQEWKPVWTVPKDPKPGERYNIKIRIFITSKNNVKPYPKSDVKGNVIGTDGYQDYFGGPNEPGNFRIENNAILLDPIPVPGAMQLVKDIITVESKRLKEKQVIEIVF